MQSVVMTPVHPRWGAFIDQLSRAVICAATTDNARHVLESMGGIDVDASLEALRRLNGRCDCEIVFQVAGLETVYD
jgi:hypothetical protein